MNYEIATNLLDSWQDDILNGVQPETYKFSPPFDVLEFGPGSVACVGAPPGKRKTAMIMQCVFDALLNSPQLRCVVCNVEMKGVQLLNRQLARLSGVELDFIQKRKVPDNQRDRILHGVNVIRQMSDRLTFLRPPFNMQHIDDVADATSSELIVLDYIQRIDPIAKGADTRGNVSQLMSEIRQLADAGKAILLCSAVGRGSGGDYSNLSMGSFRESSEIEYAVDDGFILSQNTDTTDQMTLNHFKARYYQLPPITMKFNGKFQRFSTVQGGIHVAA